MKNHCNHCQGSGQIAINCPFCRDTDMYEHEDLASRKCHGCSGLGFVELECPSCRGAGVCRETASANA